MLQERPLLDTDWDYRTANTKEYTHGIHPYPAMMIPQVARRLVQTYQPMPGRDGDVPGVLFDPYCGTGTTLLEGMLAGLMSIGTDLNPLARLIARTKTAPIDIRKLDDTIEDFCGLTCDRRTCRLPDIPNVDYWFSERVQGDLAQALGFIQRIGPIRIAEFFKVAFSLTVRKVSWTKNPEFKLVRMNSKQMNSHDPDVFSVMSVILRENRDAFVSLREALDEQGFEPVIPTVHEFDSVIGVPGEAVAPGSVDLVVTSPPYGDSRTTVAYGQFSRLSSQWLGYENANRIDNALMGGAQLTTPVLSVLFGVDELDDVIATIAAADLKRAGDVASFFLDYQRSITHVASVVKPGGHTCYVVGNRTVKGLEVPTAETTVAFFEANGFEHVATFRRNIPNKRMPSMNSPTNVPGELGRTMKTESIVVCRKESRP